LAAAKGFSASRVRCSRITTTRRAILQKILDDRVSEHTIVDLDGHREPNPDDVDEARVSYVNVYTNRMKATMQMFDEIDDVEQPSPT
jgi:hypothetical protein